MAESHAECIEKSMKILICVDHSDNAEHAFDYYVEHIYKPNHEVIIAHVAEMVYPVEYMFAGAGGRFPMPVGIGPSPAVAEELVEKERKKKKKIETKYHEKCEKSGIKHEFKVLAESGSGIGAPIVEEAKNGKIDLIILGTRGQGLIRRTILGSVSGYVLHHTSIPTLICPKQA